MEETYKTYPPSFLLAPYVRYYWFLRAKAVDGVFISERTLPTGCLNLVFHRSSRGMSSASGIFQPRSFVSGFCDGFSDLSFQGDVDMIVVVFQPYGAKALLGVPADEFRGADISVSDIGDSSWSELEEKLSRRSDERECINEIEKFLSARLRKFTDFDFNRIAASVAVADRVPEATVHTLSEAACLSERQFSRVFAATVGTSPKEFLRVIRFQRALDLLSAHPCAGMASIAVSAGYYDQPHMIREFKRISVYTPSEYLSVCLPFSDYFSTVR